MNQAGMPSSSDQPSRVRPVECERRTRRNPVASGSARHVGRVGALAVALGVGAAVVTVPALAYADNTGSSGSTGSGGAKSAEDSVSKTRTESGVVRRGSRGPVNSTAGGGESDGSESTSPRGEPNSSRSSSSRGRGSADTKTSPDMPSSEAPPVARAVDSVGTGTDAEGPAEPRRGARGQVPVDVEPAVDPVPVAVTESGSAAEGFAIRPSVTPAAPANSLPVPAPAEPVISAPPVVVMPAAVTPAAAAPVMTAAPPSVVSQPGRVNGMGSNLLSWLGSGGNGDAPAAAPLMWTMAAASRRELGAPSGTAKPAAATTSGEPADPVVLPTVFATPQASATGKLTADPFADVIRIFIGDGTATNPNAGLLIGNGYSWTAETCNQGTACNGGQAGLLFGNGGNGFNGGNGGSAGLLGAGGAGGWVWLRSTGVPAARAAAPACCGATAAPAGRGRIRPPVRAPVAATAATPVC